MNHGRVHKRWLGPEALATIAVGAKPRVHVALGGGVLWGISEYLLLMEVFDEVRRLCLSQGLQAPAMVGTDLGDRLRDARAMFVRDRGNKKGHFAGLF
jgi:hypothetical protein